MITTLELPNYKPKILVPHHFSELMRLYITCGQNMREKGLLQWDENYPNPKIIEETLKEPHTVGWFQNRELVAAVTVDFKQDPLYKTVNWMYEEPRAGVIHRLAVHPKFQGEGLGKKIMRIAENWAKEKGMESLRLDAFSINPGIQKLYISLGYKAVGEIYIYPERPSFICFEKKLD